jgi:tetratricopeptide (TPR) repeat protein
MTDAQHAKSPSEAETEVWNAIAYFEKILEALPHDRLSLETLAGAYEKVGDHTRAKACTLRLARVLIDEADEDDIDELLVKIRQFDRSDPEVKAVITSLESLNPAKVMAVVRDDMDQLSRRSTNIAGEISMAWNLLQANKLNQEDYARIVHDLSENSARTPDMPVSTLHVLQDRSHPGFNEILAFIASDCSLPFISLANFDIQPATAALLPLEFCIKRGAMVFELMGNDALAAILNPYDTQLSRDMEDLTGKTCYRFLVTPADFDAALEKIKKMQAET